MNLSVLYEYQAVLLGKKTSMSTFFFNQTALQNEKTALDLIRYVVEKHLKWTPEQMRDCFTWETVKLMKLESIIKYVIFPPEADVKTDLFIIAGKLYPDRVKINTREMTLLVYKKIISRDQYKFPKGFFDGNEGRYKALLCLQYMLNQYTSFKSVEEMYRVFSTPKASKLLKKYKLQAVRVAMYEYAIDYLHDALPEGVKSEYYYRFYRFKIVNKKLKRAMESENSVVENKEGSTKK